MVPHTSSGRSVAILLLLAALLLAPRPAYGGWSAEPVQVHSTTAECPQVAACGDAAYGAVVVWQELTSGNTGVLRAQHLLATGDVDPAWSVPASVCADVTARSAIGAVSDGFGGAYIWWLEASMLRLTRVGPDGLLASGWPAGGRLIGTQANAASRPTVLADGAHGVYVAWLQPVVSSEILAQFRVTHLGPSNSGADGCPPGGRTIGWTGEQTEYVNTASIGLAPDGGLWAAWGTTVVDPVLWLQPGDWRLTRLLPSVQAAPGWTMRGVSTGVFHGESLDPNGELIAPPATLVGTATDGADGAYVVNGMPWETPSVRRYVADGSVAPGWPAAGFPLGWGVFYGVDAGGPAEVSLRALPDAHGGVWAGFPQFYDHGTDYAFQRFAANGATTIGSRVGTSILGLDYARNSDGSVFVASCHPNGPYGPMDPNAYVSACGGSSAPTYLEYHDEILMHWYGDEGIAPSDDGGAILVWSQAHERFGIFAVRLGATGLVTEVPPSATTGPRLALRFTPGAGVRARATFGVAGRAQCALHDVAGRIVAGGSLDVTPGVREWTIPDTAGLPAGLYFASVSGAGEGRTARVIVIR
jgi:hypothetical protein